MVLRTLNAEAGHPSRFEGRSVAWATLKEVVLSVQDSRRLSRPGRRRIAYRRPRLVQAFDFEHKEDVVWFLRMALKVPEV